jgi:multicomponent Na+:H+ antiporter subunit E
VALRMLSLACWAFLVWVLLTWTLTVEQLAVGAAVSAAVAAALAPLGGVAAPWRLLSPRRLFSVIRLAAVSAGRIFAANLRLSRRIWSPGQSLHRGLRSGMVIAATGERSEGGLAAIGILTSVIVENQLVDIDRSRGRLQYHAVDVPGGGPEQVAAATSAPAQRLLRGLEDER